MHLKRSWPAVSHLNECRSELKLMVTAPSQHTHRREILLFCALKIKFSMHDFTDLCFVLVMMFPHCSNEVNHLWFSAVGTYSQLHAEGNAEHLETLHLKVHPDGCFVVLLKKAFTKPQKHKTNAYRHSLARLEKRMMHIPSGQRLTRWKFVFFFKKRLFKILKTHTNMQPGSVFGR